MQAVIDRFEENKAVLIFSDNQTLVVPKKYLPPKPAVGDILNLKFTLNPKATQKQKAKVKSLLFKIFPFPKNL